MDADLDHVCPELILALIRAGVTGDATFGDLLDAIDEYAAMQAASGTADPER